MALASKTNFAPVATGFDDMISRFGVVTVMNARVYNQELSKLVPTYNTMKVHDIVKALLAIDNEINDETPMIPSAAGYVKIDSLKIANINMEGPDKTVTGGQYANPLIKYGKSATIEMQDALGDARVLEAFGVAYSEQFTGAPEGGQMVIHATEDFAGPKTILGESFFINQRTGAQVPVYILLYQVLPDSIMNLTQDAEGDATVFDLNGSLLTTTIKVGDSNSGEIDKGVFYSVLPQNSEEVSAWKKVTYKATTAEAENIGAEVLALFNNGTNSFDSKAEGNNYTIKNIYPFTVYDKPSEGSVVTGDKHLTTDTTYYVGIAAK